MEIIVEIPEEKVKALNITDSKISFEELEQKVALGRMIDAMYKSQNAIKGTELENWSIDDINNFIKEAKDYYAADQINTRH